MRWEGLFFWGDLTPKDVRERRREVVFDLQSLFQCASFPERFRRGGVFFSRMAANGVLRQALLCEGRRRFDILEPVIIESARGWEGIQSSQRSRDAVRADKSAVRGNTSGFASSPEKFFARCCSQPRSQEITSDSSERADSACQTVKTSCTIFFDGTCGTFDPI